MGYQSRPFVVFLLASSTLALAGCPLLFSPKGLMPAVLNDSLTVPALRAASVIYVDFSYTGSDSNGTEARPYLNLTQAVNAAASGDTIRIKGGGSTTSSPETLRITKPVRIEASGGAVAIGDATANALVPNVVNMTQAAAQTAITAAGLTLGTVTQQYHDTIPSGRVISENPIAGRIVALGSTVAIAVSKGPESAGPTVTLFLINNGAWTAASRTVKLNNACSGAPTQYMASESSSFTGATWQNYSTAPLFTLSSGDGNKTIYFKTKNAIGESLPATDTISLYQISGVTEDTILLDGNVPFTMVWIPGGIFWMGRYAGEQDSWAWEDPQHQVTVPGFWIGKYEVTKRQWKAVMNTEPWFGRTEVLSDLDSPAVYVGWNDAKAFISALNTYSGLAFRLPTEAEWEYACRAGMATRFYWGNDPSYTQINNYAWWDGNAYNASEQYAHVAGLKLPNGYGLHDMSGNVWEWCEDDDHYDYIGAPADGSAWVNAPRTSSRMLRGGSWYTGNDESRSAGRFYGFPSNVWHDIGFRLVK